MGLFAGMSVISAIEMIFHFMRQFVAKMYNRRRLKVQALKIVTTSKIISHKTGHRAFQYFIKIAAKSDIHGVHFLVDQGRKFWEKLFWALVIILLTVFSSWQIFEVIWYSELNPIEFGIDEKIWTINDVGLGFFKVKIERLKAFALGSISCGDFLSGNELRDIKFTRGLFGCN